MSRYAVIAEVLINQQLCEKHRDYFKYQAMHMKSSKDC